MAHKGTSTFIIQRLTAVILIPLIGWFLWSVVAHAGDDIVATRAWAEKPLNAVMLGAFISIGAIHMRIGMFEVIQDYVHGSLGSLLKMLNWALSLLVIGLTWWSLFEISFTRLF